MKREKLLRWLVLNDVSLRKVETTAEAKSALPVVYKKWVRILSLKI